MRKERFVCIEWEDASNNGGYYDAEDEKRFNPIPTQTVGHLIKKDRRKALVAQERYSYSDGDITSRHIQCIPRKMITKIRYLENKDARQK